jgi:hypothetical protein
MKSRELKIVFEMTYKKNLVNISEGGGTIVNRSMASCLEENRL